MAGVAGRSGGSNRTMSTTDALRSENAPTKLGMPRMALYLNSTKDLTIDEIYEKLALDLFELGVTEEQDGHILTMLATQYHFLQEAYKVYKEYGIHGKIVQVPVYRAITDAQKEVRILLAEWYLTPSTRGKRPIKNDDDSLDSLMNFTH